MHWARLMSGLQRAARYLVGDSELFRVVYVDGILRLVRGGAAPEDVAVMLLFLCGAWFTTLMEKYIPCTKKLFQGTM